MNEQNCLILFAREPVLGKVKTRLIPALGEQGALVLYCRLLQRQIDLANNYSCASKLLMVDGDAGNKAFSSFEGDILSQQGDDLGERMYRALDHALATHTSAVLIGCDCPEMDCSILEAAFSALSSGSDVVVGPAVDGGYVLIGMRESHKDLFTGIDWGTEAVMEQTQGKLETLGLSWHRFEPLHDIDEPADLVFLADSELIPADN